MDNQPIYANQFDDERSQFKYAEKESTNRVYETLKAVQEPAEETQVKTIQSDQVGSLKEEAVLEGNVDQPAQLKSEFIQESAADYANVNVETAAEDGDVGGGEHMSDHEIGAALENDVKLDSNDDMRQVMQELDDDLNLIAKMSDELELAIASRAKSGELQKKNESQIEDDAAPYEDDEEDALMEGFGDFGDELDAVGDAVAEAANELEEEEEEVFEEAGREVEVELAGNLVGEHLNGEMAEFIDHFEDADGGDFEEEVEGGDNAADVELRVADQIEEEEEVRDNEVDVELEVAGEVEEQVLEEARKVGAEVIVEEAEEELVQEFEEIADEVEEDMVDYANVANQKTAEEFDEAMEYMADYADVVNKVTEEEDVAETGDMLDYADVPIKVTLEEYEGEQGEEDMVDYADVAQKMPDEFEEAAQAEDMLEHADVANKTAEEEYEDGVEEAEDDMVDYADVDKITKEELEEDDEDGGDMFDYADVANKMTREEFEGEVVDETKKESVDESEEERVDELANESEDDQMMRQKDGSDEAVPISFQGDDLDYIDYGESQVIDDNKSSYHEDDDYQELELNPMNMVIEDNVQRPLDDDYTRLENWKMKAPAVHVITTKLSQIMNREKVVEAKVSPTTPDPPPNSAIQVITFSGN